MDRIADGLVNRSNASSIASLCESRGGYSVEEVRGGHGVRGRWR